MLVVVGDTAAADGDALEQCLGRFHFEGPKLFVAGNHELWTQRDDSYAIFAGELPYRVAAMGWHWLQNEPYIAGDVAIIGRSIGWYDYSFAQPGRWHPPAVLRAQDFPGRPPSDFRNMPRSLNELMI